MRLMKRALVWLVAGLLILSLIPPGLARQVSAAATYFIPDNTELRNTSNLQISAPGQANFLDRSNVYIINSGLLTITGTFSHVSKDSLQVKVEQLNMQSDGTWKPDALRSRVSTVLADPDSTNRFTVNNLELFNGFNRITFSGLQGSTERLDTFYVLYDRVPYIQSLRVTSGGVTTNLNEGAQVVVESQAITLQGVAKNVTKVTVSVNNGTPVVGSILSDGTFYSPALTLKAGLNTLNLTLSNTSDSITISRAVYYFDPNQPFTDIVMTHSSGSYQMVNNQPVITSGLGINNTATLQVTMLVKYIGTANEFKQNTTYRVVGGTTVTEWVYANSYNEIIIPGTDGVTPAYRLVTFTTDAFEFEDDGTNDLEDQDFTLTTTYTPSVGSPIVSTFPGKFRFLPNETLIQEMYLLPGYDGAAQPDPAGANVSKTALNNSEVNEDSFYIYVKTNQDPGAFAVNPLKGVYLPSGTVGPTITHIRSFGANTHVYQVTGFASGQHQVRFGYTNSKTTYNANITYSSKDYIFISNLFDGQTYEFDSSNANNELDIIGEYVGFSNFVSAQYFVNGITPAAGQGSDTTFEAPGQKKFDLTLNISDSGPLVYGENRIVFVGTTQVSGILREIRKEIRIFIIDKNISTIAKFMPTVAPPDPLNRQVFPSPDLADPSYTPEILNNIFAVTPEFIYQDNGYRTSQLKYDLVIRGGGARILNLNIGSQLFFNMTLPATPIGAPSSTFTYSGKTYTYDFAGTEDDFILRIRDIDFAVPGTHVYNLELINGTGARSTQRLEVTREVTAYRILAPQPTVGNSIIVNKNFVRFDIEAEGAIEVLIDGESASKRPDIPNRFVYDYVGLKPDKENEIDVEIVREQGSIEDTVTVYYTSAVKVDSQYMMPLASKMSVFNKTLELSFPKGTVLQSAGENQYGITKFYKDNKLLFGIADPVDGVVERRNDYGNIINVHADARSTGGATTITISPINVQRFNATDVTGKFTRVSPIYWISGGLGEEGDPGSPMYKPAMNGQAPYYIEGNQVRSFADPITPLPQERRIVPSERGTLTIAFDPSIVDEVESTISAFRFTEDGVWENIGGEVDIKKHTIKVPFDEFGYYMVGKLKSGYNDITNHPWARNILNGLYSKGIMSNLRFDEFGADDQTTRGEFATLLVKGLNFKLNYDETATFQDVVYGVKSATWDYEHIETAARAGIISGLAEGFFGPDMPITREQAAVMAARALKLKLSINDAKLEKDLAKMFVDSASINRYARPAVQAIAKAGIMTGSPVNIPGSTKTLYNFNPTAYMTRAEAGSIAVKLLQKYTKVFPKNFN